MILKALTFTIIVIVTTASTNEPKPGHCYNRGLYIKEGEKVPAPIGECVDLMCMDAEQNKVGVMSCGLYQPAPGCKPLGEDLSKPYPDCCYRTTCNTDQANTHGPKPGYCYDRGLYIKEGEKVPAPIGECVDLMCMDAEQNKVGVMSCGLYKPAPGCKPLGEDLTKPYPDCCYRTTCNTK